jgi:hypothetical protein
LNWSSIDPHVLGTYSCSFQSERPSNSSVSLARLSKANLESEPTSLNILNPRQQDFLGACAMNASPGTRANAMKCYNDLLNMDGNQCSLQSYQMEQVIATCVDTKIRIVNMSHRPLDMSMSCAKVAATALDIIQYCSECKSDLCPVQGTS